MTPPHTPRNWRRWLLGLLALSVVFYLALPSLSSTAPVRRWVENAASSVSGYQATIEAFRINYDLSVTVRSLTLARGGDPPFLEADRLRIGWLSSSLLRRRVGTIEVESPRLFAGRLPSSRPSNGEPGAASLPIEQIIIQDGWVEYPVEERTVAVGPFDLSVDSIRAGAQLDLQGRSEIADGGGEVDWKAQLGSDLQSVKGRAVVRADDVQRLSLAFAQTRLPEALGEASASLALEFDGSLEGEIRLGVDATLRHPGLPEAATVTGGGTVAPLSRTGTLQLELQPQPHLPALHVDGRLDQDAEGRSTLDAELHWDAVALEQLSRPFSLPLRSLKGELGLHARVNGAIADPIISGKLELADASLQAPSWAATGSLAAPFRLAEGTLLSDGKGFQLTNWKGSIASFDWQLEGLTMTGSIDATGGEMAAEAETLVATGIQFHDADYLRAGEGLTLRGPLEARLDESGSMQLKLDVVASQGEILWDRFYMKLASHPPRVRGTLDVSSERVVELDGLELSMAGVGQTAVDGRYDWETGRRALQADVDLPGLAALYDVAVRDAFRDAYPVLERTDLQGQASATIDYREDASGRSVSGNLQLADMRVTSSDPSLEVRGLNLALPFELGDNLPSIEPRTGLLRIAEMRIGAVQTADVAIALSVRANQFAITSGVRVPLLGGALFLADFDADRLAGPEPRARFSLHLQEIELGELSSALGGPTLRGTLTGAIPNVTVESGEIRSEGEIRAHLFDGEARVHNLRFSQLLSPVPSLELDLGFNDISLGQMTDTFEIGHVSGIVRGRVDDLEIVRQQPVRFQAWMETVPHPDVPQRVSVAAIRQLSILGGSGGDPLSHGILTFFDEYRYAKMGFRCSLRNDRFTLHGIEEIDGKEYLVVGSVMPPRVNVISHNQIISFSEMIRRLERALEKTKDEPSEAGQ